MTFEIRTRSALAAFIEAGEGYVYNDFGGRNPRMCPIHTAACPSLRRMLSVSDGELSVRKLCSQSLAELVAEVERRGKVYSFCGNESGLASNVSATFRASVAFQISPGSLSARRSLEDDPFELRIEAASRVVDVWSADRLQYNSKPSTRHLKQAIGDAVAVLEAREGELLSAVYTSASTDFGDAENVLLYNVGTGRFAAAARQGLRFERVFSAASPAPGGSVRAEHHHRYTIVPRQSQSEHWRRGETRVRLAGVPIPKLNELSKPDGVWLAVRERALTRPAHAGPYGLLVTLVTPEPAVRPASIVKPLLDGLITGLHAHDGTDLEAVSSRLAKRLGLEVSRVRQMLVNPREGVLGVCRLLWRWRDGVQWHPADDLCVSCSLLHETAPRAAGWHVDFELFSVSPC